MNNILDEQKVSVRVKIAALWTAFMFLYIYVDYFGLYTPGYIEDILKGKVFTFEISQIFLTAGLISVSIPAVMIFLSIFLRAKISRLANIIIATLYIPYTLFNLVGDSWVHMWYGAAVETAILVLIIRYAIKWPSTSNNLE